MDIRELCRWSGMTDTEICNYFRISIRTLQRYKKKNKAPRAILECLSMLCGMLPNFKKRNDFKEWSFGGGFLCSPEGDKFTSGDVRAGKLALEETNRQHRIEVRNRQKMSLVRKSAKIYYFPVRQRESDRIAN